MGKSLKPKLTLETKRFMYFTQGSYSVLLQEIVRDKDEFEKRKELLQAERKAANGYRLSKKELLATIQYAIDEMEKNKDPDARRISTAVKA